jgi:hypothetical protein
MLNVVVTVVQQIMTESNGSMLEEAKILAITNIVLNGAKWPLEYISPSKS